MNLLRKISDATLVSAHFISAVCLAMVVVLINLRIFLRYFFGMGMNWIPGIVTLLVCWAISLGYGVYFGSGRFIAIDYFYNKFPPRVKRADDLLRFAATAAVGAVFVKYAIDAVKMSNYKSTISIIPIPYYCYTAALVAGLAIGVFAAVVRRMTERLDKPEEEAQ